MLLRSSEPADSPQANMAPSQQDSWGLCVSDAFLIFSIVAVFLILTGGNG